MYDDRVVMHENQHAGGTGGKQWQKLDFDNIRKGIVGPDEHQTHSYDYMQKRGPETISINSTETPGSMKGSPRLGFMHDKPSFADNQINYE